MYASCNSSQFDWHIKLSVCINSIILTALENKCPLKSLSFLDFRMTKGTYPKINKLNIKIMYHCILQVHSISCTKVTHSCLATALTSFICCKARLVTRDLSFMCLHIIYMTIVVTTNKIIALKSRKLSTVELLKKTFLLGNSISLLVCLFCKLKISYLH